MNHFPVDINKAELIFFVEAVHANNLLKRQSTTGFVFTFAGHMSFTAVKLSLFVLLAVLKLNILLLLMLLRMLNIFDKFFYNFDSNRMVPLLSIVTMNQQLKLSMIIGCQPNKFDFLVFNGLLFKSGRRTMKLCQNISVVSFNLWTHKQNRLDWSYILDIVSK